MHFVIALEVAIVFCAYTALTFDQCGNCEDANFLLRMLCNLVKFNNYLHGLIFFYNFIVKLPVYFYNACTEYIRI